nr:hypothetical protein GCM10020093_058720 [Planobispora longispora]
MKKKVPNVLGLTPAEAKVKLAQAGLKAKVGYEPETDLTKCTGVVGQRPSAGEMQDVQKPVEITADNDACPTAQPTPSVTPTPSATPKSSS